jgi:hypothetical protein
MRELREMTLLAKNLTAKLSFRQSSIKVGWNNSVEGPEVNLITLAALETGTYKTSSSSSAASELNTLDRKISTCTT